MKSYRYYVNITIPIFEILVMLYKQIFDFLTDWQEENGVNL